tara:strand:- start:1789 stop:2331 length:543 start_codon:yes stop_codon:yes gene_type:complete
LSRPDLPGTDRQAGRILSMGNRKRTPAEIISWATIALSLATMSGLALGHDTGQTMHPRLSAKPSLDPIERYALGQNAYERTHIPSQTRSAEPFKYADTSHEIGRYKNGVRLLVPAEPARKIERLRLERLQAWNEDNFGSDTGLDEGDSRLAKRDMNDDVPIDVGAVRDAPEMAAMQVDGV